MKKNKKTAKSKQLAVTMILDETGSMQPYLTQTLSGVNEYVDGLRGTKGMKISLVCFNSDRTHKVWDDELVSDVEKLTQEQYRPMACTPLYDAIGRTLTGLDKKKPQLIVIMTDGEENASVEFTKAKVADLVKEYEKAGFSFVYLGANQDAYKESGSLGISVGNTVNYAQSNTRAAFSATLDATQCYCSTTLTGRSTQDLFINVDKDALVR